MMTWDSEDVAKILRSEAIFEDNSSYRFEFKTHGQLGVLIVFPDTGDISLSIGDRGGTWLNWQLNCASITCNNEIPEEGGSTISFKPTRATSEDGPCSHWVVLAPSDDGVEILTVFRNHNT